MKETDLYLPCKNLLESQGYQVKGEVLKTDITAIKDDYMIIIELKLAISLKLIYQAIERQRVADKVYIALPRKVVNAQKSHVKHFMSLLKRLEIGLIVVYSSKAEVLLETFGFDLQKSLTANKKHRERLIKEFSLRKNEDNIGGSRGKKITHYREKVIEVAKFLYLNGEKSPKEIKTFTGLLDTTNILRKNYYKWFLNISRGKYTLTKLGIKEIEPFIKHEEMNKNPDIVTQVDDFDLLDL